MVVTLSSPVLAGKYFAQMTEFFTHYFSWLIMLSTAGFVALCAYLIFSKKGDIKLGKKNTKPDYSYTSWLAMLFAAGMGTGLIFNAAAEPMLHMVEPPALANASDVVHARAALVIAYFAFNKNKPMLASTPITHKMDAKKTSTKVTRNLVNLISIFAVIFGVLASLGHGVFQISRGLDRLDFENIDKGLILAAISVSFIISAYTKIDNGIKTLSNINIVACIFLMIFAFVEGPSLFVMEIFTTALGQYISQLTTLSFNLRPYNETEWISEWTLTYLLWWVAWGPFVGMFIARISRGRTIREFLLGVILVPCLFSFFWFSVFGGAALDIAIHENGEFVKSVAGDLPSATYQLLETFPFAEFTTWLVIFLVFIFLVTSADSSAYALAIFSTGGEFRPHKFQRLFWGMVLSLTTFAILLSADDIFYLRAISVAAAAPYLFIMIWQVTNLMRELHQK